MKIAEKLNMTENAEENNEVVRMIDRLDRKDKFKLIFRWNNGLVLAEKLKELTDSNFEFLPNDMIGNMKFIDKNNRLIEIDCYGNVVSSSVKLDPVFEQISQRRLNKTNGMLKGLGYSYK